MRLGLLVPETMSPRLGHPHLVFWPEGRWERGHATLAYNPCVFQRRRSPASRGSGRARPLGVEGLAIDRRLQRHGRRVAQGGQGEAGRFGHLDKLSHALRPLVTVERQLRLDPVAHHARITGNDRAFAGVPRCDSEADVFRLDVERSCHLHELCGESEPHGDGEVAQG